MNRIVRVLVAVFVLILMAGSARAKNPEAAFQKYCTDAYLKSKTCPADICQVGCLNGKESVKCLKVCTPRKCTEIDAEQCPKDYCEVMTNCAKKKMCHYQMVGEKPKCGDLAYAGQDVDCCEGLARRCGVEFFDGNCDMEGENSFYNLPICIPCGDGVCGNFENRCNCPEDCKNPTLDNPVKKADQEKLPAAKRSSTIKP